MSLLTLLAIGCVPEIYVEVTPCTTSEGTGGSMATELPGAGEGGSIDSDGGLGGNGGEGGSTIMFCKHCSLWLKKPGDLKYSDMCVSSVFIAQEVFKCAEELGDCGSILLGDAPNIECLNALHDQCSGPMTECEQDVE